MTQETNLATNLGVQMIAEISVALSAALWPTVIVQLKRYDKEFCSMVARPDHSK